MKSWHKLTREQANELYAGVLRDGDTATLRQLCLEDLFFLLTIACRRQDINRDWLYARCREVENAPDGYLDLWAREHYKSTIITFGKSIQDILEDSSVTIGIFSHTRPIAKAFLKQIKIELETNTFLQGLFPDVLYTNPEKESPSWSLDNGITVRRKSNPKENTVEAWGLVDGQPTSKHYRILVYDDVVTRESVTSPDMMAKTTDAWALSKSLGAEGGVCRTIGTYYHFNDSYHEMEKRASAKIRKYPATTDGAPDGPPAFLSAQSLENKRRDMGPYIYGCQMLLNPVADNAQGFREDWLQYYDTDLDPSAMNIYALVDPANAKKKTNDFTVMLIIGLAADNNYYLLYGIRDRMNLTQRTNKLFSLARQYRFIKVGYEQYGMQADVQHIQHVQNQLNYRFPITELGGVMPKEDRIKKLVPIFEQSRFYMPRRLLFKDCEGNARDFIQEFVNDEYKAFPVAIHDDMLDCLARITEPDLAASFPSAADMRMRENREAGVKAKPNMVKRDYDVLKEFTVGVN